ncbi:sigma-70 family RNA polymerase sigma factor [Streptomyces roseolilacinus]|uniref:sigma-70 family RNA polymerase sigma factor n=1 Tax=Streptomyces roseolilacinus TaxID=66904 RepID=UPI003801424C
MNDDGGDEPLGGTDAAEAAGRRPAARVPAQGGRWSRRGASRADGASVPPQRGRVRRLRPVAGPDGDAVSGPGAGPDAGAGLDAGAGSGPVPPVAVELPPSDAELVQRMRGGDDSAYEELFLRHAEAVRRYARTCCRDRHTADDLTAEVFARTLQAVRRGAGPEQAVRAYLLTTVRHVAAAWAKTAKREQLVEDFGVFATEAARVSGPAGGGTVELGADVRAMQEAEQSLAVRAFRSLPERWQAVLWHTTVEEESPREVAPLFGLTANATAVLASRAREGLKQAYLQAHVNQSLTAGGDCARYADRLGAYARGGLRTRAERGLRGHLEECVKCRLAAGELAQVNAGIPALVPVAVVGWFAAGYSLKAAGVAAGSAAGTAGAAGAAGAGGNAAEGLGVAAKAGAAATLAIAATAGLVWVLAGGPDVVPRPQARPPVARSVVPPPVDPSPPSASPAPPLSRAAPATAPGPGPGPGPETSPEPARKPPSTHPPTSTPAPAPTSARTSAPAPGPAPTPAPGKVSPSPARTPTTPAPTSTPAPTPTPVPEPVTYRVGRLKFDVFGDHARPELRLGGSGWVWQRYGLSVGGTTYEDGITVHSKSSVVIDLNRECSTYQALAGVDDMAKGLGSVRFSVWADGVRLWRSPVVDGGDPAVPVRVGIAGRATIRLVTEPSRPSGALLPADWAQARISCAGG